MALKPNGHIAFTVAKTARGIAVHFYGTATKPKMFINFYCFCGVRSHLTALNFTARGEGGAGVTRNLQSIAKMSTRPATPPRRDKSFPNSMNPPREKHDGQPKKK